MKNIFYILSVLIFITTSCCDDNIEIARIPLSQIEQDMIPYELNDAIPFVHSNGFKFSITVSEYNLDWEKDIDCEHRCCGQQYSSYQFREIKLTSDYPSFKIDINNGNSNYYTPNRLYFRINGYSSMIEFDSLGNFETDNFSNLYDTITINQKLYNNVLDVEFVANAQTDSLINRPASFLYNKESGLIQIITSNNETYTIE